MTRFEEATHDYENLTVCPIADDVEWYKRRPNGAGHAVYKKLTDESFPNGWMVLCKDCYRKRREELLSRDKMASNFAIN